MLLRSNSVENAVLELLVRYQKLSVQELYQALDAQYMITISLPQLYKILQRMTKEYILVKKYGVIMLNTYRISQIEKDVETLKASVALPEKWEIVKHGTTQYYTTWSINEQETVWIDLTAKILEHEKPTDLYMYDSHLYYMLWFFDTWTRVYDPQLPDTGKMYYLLWNDTFLDRYTQSLAKSKRMYFHTSPEVNFTREWYSIRVLGNYIIEIFIPEALQHTFEDIYTYTNSLEEFNLDLYKWLFGIKTQTKFRVTHDKYRAQEIATYIKKFF